MPATNGSTVTNYDTTERGGPDQAYARFKGTDIADWTLGPVNASFTGRYISAVTESQGSHRLGSRFYGDVQLQFRPGWMDRRVALTFGVNNVFNNDPRACFSCSLNNYDPITYDVPGQFGYLRLSFGL